MGSGKKALFGLAAAILVLALIEGLCFVFAFTQKDRYTWFDPANHLVDARDVRRLAARHHPTLGWKEVYRTPFGERPRERSYDVALLASFGDSFTQCAEVADDETWQTYLSRAVEKDVYNFGAGGYGTGQALLRFREDYPKVRTPVVSLGLITENINRVVNRYRSFYTPRTRILLTKPRFVLDGGELVLLENPIQSADDIEKLADPGYVASLGENDLWYNRDAYPRRAFPYSRILANRSFWLEVYHGKLGSRISDVDPRPWVNLWSQDEYRDLMYSLFDSFFEEVEALGARPLLMLLPRLREVRHSIKRGSHPPAVQAIVDYGAATGHDVFNGIEALAAEAGSPKELRSFFAKAHLSASGNEALARQLHAFLEARGLLETKGAALPDPGNQLAGSRSSELAR